MKAELIDLSDYDNRRSLARLHMKSLLGNEFLGVTKITYSKIADSHMNLGVLYMRAWLEWHASINTFVK